MIGGTPAITIAIIGIVIPAVFAVFVRRLTYRHAERKEGKASFSIDDVLSSMHTAFLGKQEGQSR